MIICQHEFKHSLVIKTWISQVGIFICGRELAELVSIPHHASRITIALHDCHGKQRVRMMVSSHLGWHFCERTYTQLTVDEVGMRSIHKRTPRDKLEELDSYIGKHVWMEVTYEEIESRGE